MMGGPLERLLAGSAEAMAGDLRSQLLWMDQLVRALDSEAANLGDAGKAAATDLRAAVGAIVQFARGSQSKAELGKTQLLVRALTTRALTGIFAALAETYRELARADDAPRACGELASLFMEASRSLAKGQALPKRWVARFEALGERLDDPSPR